MCGACVCCGHVSLEFPESAAVACKEKLILAYDICMDVMNDFKQEPGPNRNKGLAFVSVNCLEKTSEECSPKHPLLAKAF